MARRNRLVSRRNGWDAHIDFVGTLWTGKFIPDAIKRAINEVPDYGKPILEKHSPVKTGRLRDSWSIKTGTKTLTIYNPAYYAGFVDLGTRTITPRRFVDRSVTEIVGEFRKRASEYIMESVPVDKRPRKPQIEALNRLRTKGITSVSRRAITKE